jgi:3-oxoadipate enol-lactonase
VSVPVVLLHPLGVDHRFWGPVIAAVPDGLGRVVALDLLGHGKAPLPAVPATVEEMADAVEAELVRHGRVHLVGVSLGGLVAQVVAARSPDLVKRLVVADAVAVYPEPMRSMWRQRAALVRASGLQAVSEPMEALWFTPAFREKHPDRVATVRGLLMDTDPEGYARACEALAVADTTAVVSGISAPMLVACGTDDAQPFRMATDWFAQEVPGTRVAWLEGGHATAYEHPREFAELLVDFLQ